MSPLRARLARAVTALRKMRSRSAAEWFTVFEAVIALAIARLAIIAVPASRRMSLLGKPAEESSDHRLTPREDVAARQVRWAVAGLSDHTPWTSNCLPQALAAKYMLRRRGIAATLSVGAKFSDDRSALEAHAWLRCGDLTVTGGSEGANQSYGAVTTHS